MVAHYPPQLANAMDIMASTSALLSMPILLSSILLAVHIMPVSSALVQLNPLPATPNIPITARTIDKFSQIKRGMSMEQLISICGQPDADIGSGLNIYLYNLSDGSSVIISGGSTIFAIRHSKPVKKIRAVDRSPLLMTAQKFYQWNIEKAESGLPTAEQLLPVQNLLAPELVRSLGQASAIESCLVRSAPKDIKPAIFEGSMFVDNYEGVTKVNTLSLSGQGDMASVTATLEYTDPKQTATRVWVDQLIVKKKAGQWLIEDIKFTRKTPDDLPYSSKTLTNILAKYIEKYQNACKS